MEKKADTLLSVIGGSIMAIYAKISMGGLLEITLYAAAGGLVGGFVTEAGKWVFHAIKEKIKKRKE